MRRRRRTGRALRGQLLFVENGEGRITVDCLLIDEDDDDAVLCTLSFRPPDTGGGVIAVLTRWREEQASVDVTMKDGVRGPCVEIASHDGRLTLDPSD